MSCFIHESLAAGAPHSQGSAGGIANPEFRASVAAEIEFAQVAVEVLVVHVLVHTDQTAFEDRKEVLQRVGVDIAARPFVLGMVHRFVLIRLALIDGRAVSDQTAPVIQMLHQSAADVFVVKVHAADCAAALDQTQNLRRGLGIERQILGLAGLGRLGEVGFIRLNGLAFAANRACIVRRGHCKANPVPHVPRGFHAHTQGALKLAGADAFLAGAHQVHSLQPNAKRRVRVLENGADLHRKGLAALVALAKANARALAVQLADLCCIAVAAVRADRTSRPKKRLDVFVSRWFGMEMWGIEDGSHVDLLSARPRLRLNSGYVK
jgi:hypothetical protein